MRLQSLQPAVGSENGRKTISSRNLYVVYATYTGGLEAKVVATDEDQAMLGVLEAYKELADLQIVDVELLVEDVKKEDLENPNKEFLN